MQSLAYSQEDEMDLESGFERGLTFDPVCGAVVLELDLANQFFDGRRTHYFCCAMCRRLFIDEWRARFKLEQRECSSRLPS